MTTNPALFYVEGEMPGGQKAGHDIVKDFDKKFVPYVDPGIYKITKMSHILVSPCGIADYFSKSPKEYK